VYLAQVEAQRAEAKRRFDEMQREWDADPDRHAVLAILAEFDHDVRDVAREVLRLRRAGALEATSGPVA
jgi:CHASE3 domain sensor protein